jgi:hypothetical protein
MVCLVRLMQQRRGTYRFNVKYSLSHLLACESRSMAIVPCLIILSLASVTIAWVDVHFRDKLDMRDELCFELWH